MTNMSPFKKNQSVTALKGKHAGHRGRVVEVKDAGVYVVSFGGAGVQFKREELTK